MGMDLIICEWESDVEREIFKHRVGLMFKMIDYDDEGMILKDVD